VPPGANEGFLDDVVGAGPVRAEPPDEPVQSLGVLGVELAEYVICVPEQIIAGGISVVRHIYYHG
jgi:hypothetical protein